jgi:glutamine amidotransferase
MGTLQEMYPDVEKLRMFGKRSRVIVSEPLNDLPGLFIEVPESSASVLDPSGYSTEPFLQS